MQMKDHPLIKQVEADVAAANKVDADNRMLEQMEASRLRAEQGQYLQRQYLAAVDEYEAARKELHAKVGQVWIAAQSYSRLTGTAPPTFPEALFNKIDVPTLIASKDIWNIGTSLSTTRIAIAGWFSTMGKTWS